MTLEAEKRKVEEDLESERVLALDKDALLERSKRREVELEEEVTALQADLDNVDSQLDRLLKIQKESDDKSEALRQAFDEAAEHLVRLEAEQQDWIIREAELVEQLERTTQEIESTRRDRDDLRGLSEELKHLAAQREEDLMRAKERMEVVTAELETKLNAEVKNRSVTFLFLVRYLLTRRFAGI